MNVEQVKKDIYTWMETFLEKPNPNIDNWAPCPFARRARIENKVSVVLGTDIESDLTALCDTWTDAYDVVIHAYALEKYTAEETIELVKKLNYELLMPADLLSLEDHPDDSEIVNGISMNQGQYILILTQRASSISNASKELKAKGYYDSWSKDYYDRAVGWREQYEAEHKIQS